MAPSKKNAQVAKCCLHVASARDSELLSAVLSCRLTAIRSPLRVAGAPIPRSCRASQRTIASGARTMMTFARVVRTPQDEHDLRTQLSNFDSANARLLGEVRLCLIVTAMLLLLQPAAQPRLALFLILTTYAVFGVALLKRVAQQRVGTYFSKPHWVDAAAYGLIVAMSGALQSRFAVFLLFPIVAAYFQRCMRPGMGLALACMLWVIGTALGYGILRPQFNLEDLQLGPIVAMIVVGLIITRWVALEVGAVGRLDFVNELNRPFSTRQRLGQAVCQVAEIVRAYHGADTCVIVMNDTKAGSWLLYEMDVRTGEKSSRGERIDATLAGSLLALPSDCAVKFCAGRLFFRSRASVTAHLSDPSPRLADGAQLEGLANLLETRSFMSVPLHSRNRAIGRLYLISQSLHHRDSDLRFLEGAMSQVGVMIENMQLVERLTLEVAHEERKKISRDLHDGTIQPYIGLKLGLEALHRKVVGDALVAQEVDDLIKLTSDSINHLRHYVGNLKREEHRPDPRRCALLPAVRRQADKFSEYYGMEVSVVADGDFNVSGRLLEEVTYIVREALSNIRRHTRARHARINVRSEDDYLVLEFINETLPSGRMQPDAFVPWSIAERAKELGGEVRVQRGLHGETSVSAAIPV
jgi:signal transduction histidine kinase